MVELNTDAEVDAEADSETALVCDAHHETIEVSDKHVHFGSDTENLDPHDPTATNITPYPRAKMTIKRRTISPNAGSDAKRIKTARTSLPAVLSQDQDHDPVKIVSEWKFAPLRAVVGERIRRLLQLKEEESEDGEEDIDGEDNDMLVLDNYEEISYPQLPAPSTPIVTRPTAVVDASERSAVKIRAGWDAERQRFHDAILAFQQEAEQAKADLSILSIEVESLGFAEDQSSSALDVLKSIRQSFDHIHESLEAELPGTVPEDATNQDLLEILIANVKEFANRLRTADRELVEKGTLNADLGNQVHTLIDRLAEKEVKRQELQESLETKDVDMRELQDDLKQAEWDRDVRQDDLEQVETEKNDLQTSVDRLTASLENYQKEETRLTELINKMEDEHRNTVSHMNAEREQTVRELEGNLDDEIERRSALEAQFREVEIERDDLVTERDSLKSEVEETALTNEAAQAKLAESQALIEDLEDRIGGAEEELSDLQDQLTELREQGTAERQQREAAESELDSSNEEIEELNRKLREQGKEANELRLKAHEMQTKNQNRIADLEKQMSDQDAQFQEDIADEVERREDAVQLSQERESQVQELKEKLADVEETMRGLLTERDARVQQLEGEVTHMIEQVQGLQDDLAAAKEKYDIQVQENETRTAELEQTLSEREDDVHDLKNQLDERDTECGNLHASLMDVEDEKRALEQEKASLERRVESEAEQMLQTTNDYQAQVDDLKQQLLHKQSAIAKAEQKSAEAETTWTQLVETQEQQIDALRLTASQGDDTIASLQQQNDRLSTNFRKYIRRSTGAMEEMQRQLAIAKGEVDAEADALKADAEAELDELETLEVPSHEPAQTQVEEVQQVVKKSRSKKKRVMDSGIGLEEDGMMV